MIGKLGVFLSSKYLIRHQKINIETYLSSINILCYSLLNEYPILTNYIITFNDVTENKQIFIYDFDILDAINHKELFIWTKFGYTQHQQKSNFNYFGYRSNNKKPFVDNILQEAKQYDFIDLQITYNDYFGLYKNLQTIFTADPNIAILKTTPNIVYKIDFSAVKIQNPIDAAALDSRFHIMIRNTRDIILKDEFVSYSKYIKNLAHYYYLKKKITESAYKIKCNPNQFAAKLGKYIKLNFLTITS